MIFPRLHTQDMEELTGNQAAYTLCWQAQVHCVA